MRMSGFLVGGMVGAAVALYMVRNKPGMLAGLNWDKAVDKAGEFVHSAKAMWDTTSVIREAADGGHKKAGGSGREPSSGHGRTDGRTEEEMIRSWIEGDPELKRQAQDILAESGEGPVQ